MKVVIYTFFGRTVKEFPILENETHHRAYEEAYKWKIANDKNYRGLWMKFK